MLGQQTRGKISRAAGGADGTTMVRAGTDKRPAPSLPMSARSGGKRAVLSNWRRASMVSSHRLFVVGCAAFKGSLEIIDEVAVGIAQIN